MNKYEVQLPFVDKIQLRKYGALNMPPILARFWQVFNIGKKNALQNQWLPDRAYTNIFVSSAPRAFMAEFGENPFLVISRPRW